MCLKNLKKVKAMKKETLNKALQYVATNNLGLSSRTMLNCFIGNQNFQINYPHDPSDFARCYGLLKAVPEWEKEIHKLKALSEVWNRLIDNWDELSKMYEKKATNWREYNSISMYDRMQSIIHNK